MDRIPGLHGNLHAIPRYSPVGSAVPGTAMQEVGDTFISREFLTLHHVRIRQFLGAAA